LVSTDFAREVPRSALAAIGVQSVSLLKLLQPDCLGFPTQDGVNQVGSVFLVACFVVRVVATGGSAGLTGVGFVAE